MSGQGPDRENVTQRGGPREGSGPDLPSLKPDDCGEFPMRIARDGTWYYRDSPIERKELAKLFSTVLRRNEEGRYLLVTPVERGFITVEDAPFTAVEMTVEGSGDQQMLRFRNNFDDWVTAGAEHPITVTLDPENGEPSPYIRIRDSLDALIVRSVFYELVGIAEPVEFDGREFLGVWSDGVLFELGEDA